MFYNRIKEYPVEYLLLAITICLQFYRLGMGEIQPWDEVLYCVRADACLKFGAWLDQTQYAVGGLYSSTHPPLMIWLMAGCVKLLGSSELILRLPSALFASLGVIMMYRVVRLYAHERTALLSSVLFGNAQVFLWYGHHAQLDVPMHTMVICVIYFLIKFSNGQLKNGHIIVGVFLGLALLIKAFQSLYILPFLLLYIWILKVPRGYRSFIIMIGVALAICSWWYIVMIIAHSEFITDYSAIFGKIASGTYHKSKQNWWYYINQLIIAVPFIALLVGLGQRRFPNYYSKAVLYASFGWLVSLLILLSVVGTKMPHFILFLLIPSVLVVSVAIDSLANSKLTKMTELCMVVVLPLCTLWSVSPQIRSLVSGRAGLYAYPSWEIVFFILPFSAIAILLMRQKHRLYFKVLSICLCIVVGANLYRWWSRNESTYIDGAKTVATYLDSSSLTKIIVLHTDYPFEDLQPQLAYYTNGWGFAGNVNRKHEMLTFEQFNDTLETGTAVVISKSWNAFNKPSEKDSIELTRIRSLLMPVSKSHFTYSRYEVFSSR